MHTMAIHGEYTKGTCIRRVVLVVDVTAKTKFTQDRIKAYTVEIEVAYENTAKRLRHVFDVMKRE